MAESVNPQDVADARRCPPAIARHQARAPAFVWVPVQLRGRVQLHQRCDRHIHAHRPWMGRRRPRVLLVLADHHPGPDLRRPELLRAREPLPGRRVHLPVVEASLQPDARLVHRMVLLLGRRGHGDRRRRYGPVGPLEHLRHRPEGSVAAPVLQQPGVLRARDAHRHDRHQWRQAPVCCRSSTTSGSGPRSSACSSSRWSCCCSSVSRTCRS